MQEGSYDEHGSDFEGRLGLYVMDVADAVEARLARRGSSIDLEYLVEIGCVRLELVENDRRIRSGRQTVGDARRVSGQVDDLLRRLENSIIRSVAYAEGV
jgi:hypothetical protein